MSLLQVLLLPLIGIQLPLIAHMTTATFALPFPFHGVKGSLPAAVWREI